MANKTIIVRGPTYFSQGDETAFFTWLSSIGCVSGVTGYLKDLHIELDRKPGDADLRELLAVFYRYRMNMKCLAQFKTARNARWFAQPDAFWHAKVFGRDGR